jgi:arylsulfatase A-like enzyme
MTTTRRSFIGSLAGAAATLPQSVRKPNFVFLFTDDQRFDTIAALGHPVVKTPNMDRLVKSGVAFTHACTQGGMIGGICSPSRAQLMTGATVFRAHRYVVDPKSPDPEYITWPERLRANGYRTFITGKWHNSVPLLQRSFSDGSNIFFGGMHEHLTTPLFDYNPAGEYPKSKAQSGKGFSSEVFASAAVRFLKEHDRSKPFALYVAFMSPHDPRMARAKFANMYDPAKMELPKNFAPEHPFDNGNLRGRDEMLAAHPRTPEEVRKHIAAYYAMVSEVDAQIGRVLEAVDLSNTYVIFAGDNGLAVGQHGLMGKQNMYDHSLRVPLVIAGPGIRGGHKADGLCHIMDLCPTICELAGTSAPPKSEGRSLAAALKNPTAALRPDVFATYQNFQRAIRTESWKLILYNVSGQKHTQLFDLTKDPLEMNNLAGKPDQAGRLGELRALLAKRSQECGDKVDVTTW